MSQPKGRIVDNPYGLFIFTPDGVFKFNEDLNCFDEIEFKNAGGTVIQSIGTVNDDPK